VVRIAIAGERKHRKYTYNEHPNPHHGQDAAALLNRTYVFGAFGGHWPGVAFLILALSGKPGGFSLGPSAVEAQP
jgi:hypothetical protein